MGDIYPYGPAAYVSFAVAMDNLESVGFTAANAQVMAAIGEAESSLNYRVINDTPSTGDYSVGIWQINYYGSLYASRASAYGTPQQLVDGGAPAQAAAAWGVWRGQGFSAWSTFTSGAYKAFLGGGGNVGGEVTEPPGSPPLSALLGAPTEDYSGTIVSAAQAMHGGMAVWLNMATGLAQIRDTNPHG
jgi:Lysozyme like domain